MKRIIVVCDASRARIFLSDASAQPLRLDTAIYFAAGRARNKELVSDEAGRVNKAAPGIMSATDPRTTPHEVEVERFASELVRIVQQRLVADHTLSLVIVAPAHFLGVLRNKLSRESEQQLEAALPMDLTHVHENDLPAHLAAAVGPHP